MDRQCEGVSATDELQKIATGLLGVSHPEIQRFRPATRTVEQPALQPTPASKSAPGSMPRLASKAPCGLKFAIAAPLRWGTRRSNSWTSPPMTVLDGTE